MTEKQAAYVLKAKRFGCICTLLLIIGYLQILPGVAFGPPLTLLQDIPPGVEIDLNKVGNFNFRVINRSDKELKAHVVCKLPHLNSEWEAGYEAPPELSWFKMTKNKLSIPAKQKGLTSLIINIPDKPENYNRKLMVYVVLEPDGSGQMGVGLGAIARVMIETRSKKDATTIGGKGIGIKPGTIVIKGKPGASFSESITIQNNEKSSVSYTQAKLSDFYPEVKFSRYQSNGYQLMPNKSWVDVIPASDLDPGKEQDIKISGTIPADAKVGGKYEEALFLKPKLSVKPEGMSNEDFAKYQQSIMTFLRIQYIIE